MEYGAWGMGAGMNSRMLVEIGPTANEGHPSKPNSERFQRDSRKRKTYKVTERGNKGTVVR